MSVFGDKIRRARVNYHICDYCGRSIEKGAQYFHAQCNDSGIRDIRMHIPCASACVRENRYLGKPFPTDGVLR